MGLGPDKEISKNEFIEAMRARLEEEEAGLGANVDENGVQKNLGALGLAVYRIATVHAETISNSSTDPIFWKWIAEVNAWLLKLSDWQQGVAQAFTNWETTNPAEKALKTAITAVPQPGKPPVSAPTALKGKIE